MRVKEYLEENKIISDSVKGIFPFITVEGQESINDLFKYELGELEMFFNEKSDVDGAVLYTLRKNNLYYSKIKESVDLVIPLEYQRLITHEGTNKEDINKVVDVLGGKTITEERVIDTDKTTTHSNRVEVDNDGSINDNTTLIGNNTSGNTNTVVGTENIDTKITNTNDNNVNRVESEKVFDSVEFTEVNKVVETNTNPSTTNTLGENKTDTTTTDTGTQGIDETTTKIASTKDDTLTLDTGTSSVLGGDSIEGSVIEDSNSKTTDTTGVIGSDSYTEKEQSIDVIEKIEAFRQLYRVSLWDIIAKDIKNVICLSVWA